MIKIELLYETNIKKINIELTNTDKKYNIIKNEYDDFIIELNNINNIYLYLEEILTEYKYFNLVWNNIIIYSNYNENIKFFDLNSLYDDYYYKIEIINKKFLSNEEEYYFTKIIIEKQYYYIHEILEYPFAMNILLDVSKNDSKEIEFDKTDNFNVFSTQNIIALINHDYYIIHTLNNFLLKDRNIAIAAVNQKNSGALGELTEKIPSYKNDKQIVYIAVKNTDWSLQYASDELCNNQEFILELIKDIDQNNQLITYISEELLSNEEFLIKAKKCNPNISL